MPNISVVVPAYNYGRYIGEAIESIQSQEGHPDLEIIVVNNGSTDETPDVLAEIDEPRMRVVTLTPNRGASAAFNAGIDEARGDFVTFLDADDRWRPGKLRHQMAILEAQPDLAAVFSDFVRFDNGSGDFYPETQFDFLPELADLETTPIGETGGHRIEDPFSSIIRFYDWPVWLQAMVFRRSAIGDVRMPVGMRLCQDMQFCMRVFRNGGVAFSREVVVEVRRHGINLTSRADEMENAKPAALKSLETESLTTSERNALRARIGRALVDSARVSLENKERLAATRELVEALAYPGFRSRAALRLLSIPLHSFPSVAST
jgi:glycosyltransferase involved in cell wall biosynthesis